MSAKTKQLFIVGNGPLPADMTAEIDAADFVVRFNEPKASIGMSGTKTDWLFLNNSGKPMERRLKDPAYIVSPIVSAARTVIFTYHPITIDRYLIRPNVLSRLKGRRADWTAAALNMFGRAGKEVLILPPVFYEDGCRALGVPDEAMTRLFPSTGYFGIRYVLEHFSSADWHIHICGFTWEGWKRHAWMQERGWVERQVKEHGIRVWT